MSLYKNKKYNDRYKIFINNIVVTIE